MISIAEAIEIPKTRVLVAEKNTAKAARYYRPELDVIRFLAFLCVFFHHAIYSFAPVLSVFGSFGLCLFFFLSSFLITQLLQREKNASGTIAVRAFYVRRILRLWPLYFLFLGMIAMVGTVLPSFHLSPGMMAGFFLMMANYYVSLHSFGALTMTGGFSFIGHLWSISIEEQFYLLWPLPNRVFRTRALVIAMVMLLVAGAAAVLVLAGQHALPADSIWTNSLVQFQMFALGALLSFGLGERRTELPGWTRLGLIVVWALLWLVAARWCGIVSVHPAPGLPMMAGYLLIGAGCFALVLGLLDLEERFFPKPLIYLGKLSYGLYVFHMMGLRVAAYLLNRTTFADSGRHHFNFGVGHLVLGLGFTFLLAPISYHWFEAPFLRLKERFTVVRSRTV